MPSAPSPWRKLEWLRLRRSLLAAPSENGDSNYHSRQPEQLHRVDRFMVNKYRQSGDPNIGQSNNGIENRQLTILERHHQKRGAKTVQAEAGEQCRRTENRDQHVQRAIVRLLLRASLHEELCRGANYGTRADQNRGELLRSRRVHFLTRLVHAQILCW